MKTIGIRMLMVIMLALVAVAVALATPGISDAVTSVFDEAATAMTSS